MILPDAVTYTGPFATAAQLILLCKKWHLIRLIRVLVVDDYPGFREMALQGDPAD